MNIDEVLNMWAEDAKFDDLNLDGEALKIPNLHSKYLKLLSRERLKLKGFHIQKKSLNTTLQEYYRGELNNPEDLEEMGREPWDKLTVKQDVNMYVERDNEMVSIVKKVAYQEEMVDTLSEILKSINNRNFNVTNAIKWRQLTNFSDS